MLPRVFCHYHVIIGDPAAPVVSMVRPLPKAVYIESLAAAIEQLPKSSVLVLLLVCYDGMSAEEAASLIGTPALSVRTELKASMQIVAARLGVYVSREDIKLALSYSIANDPENSDRMGGMGATFN